MTRLFVIRRVPAGSAQMKRVFLMLAFSTAAIAMAADDSPHTKSGGAGIAAAGLRYAKAFFPKVLNDPDSTKFDEDSVTSDHRFDATDKETGEPISIYRVEGILRSNNAFGALVPSVWSVFVVEREKTTEIAIASLDDKIVAKTKTGDRLLALAEKRAAEKEAKQREAAMARIAEAERRQEEQKARTTGNDLGTLHGKRMGKQARSLSDKEVAKRATKFAAEAGYSDEGLAAQFIEGYAEAIAAAAK